MQLTEIRTREEAQDKAIEWQQYQSNESLSYGEMLEWECYFRELANQFGLVDEFEENGII